MRDPNLSLELGYHVRRNQEITKTCWKTMGNFGKSRENVCHYSLTPNCHSPQVLHSKVHIISYLSAKFEQIKKWCFCVMHFSKIKRFFRFSGFSSIFRPNLLVAFDRTESFTSEMYFFGAFGAWCIKIKQTIQTQSEK